MKYFVRIGDTDHEVLLDGENVSLDGDTVRARIEALPGTPLQLLRLGNQVHRILARRVEGRGQYDLSVEGYRFSVEALDERARAIRNLGGRAAKTAGPAHLVAPMPGLIVRVTVSEGEDVRAGQGLVVMEAMKMENELRASANGKVKRILVTPGSAVEKGTVLLEMEG
jgi:biotin carboxyl carrier protein